MKYLTSIFLVFFLSIVHAQKDRSTSKKDVSKPVTIEKDKTGKRLALVIGNANYKVQKSLEATDNGKQYYPPINDAKDIANKLKQFNFDVLLALDANLKTMDSLTVVFKSKIKNENYSTALFYFAGHGSEEEGINYVYAIEENKEGEIAKYEVGQIMDIMKNTQVETKIVILDACRDNPSSNNKKIEKQNGLTKMDTPVGTFLVYATAPGRRAANKGTNGKNGLFTQYLLEVMKPNPEKKLVEAFQEVSVNMMNASSQVPFLTTSLKNHFYFTQKLKPYKKNGLYGFKDRYGICIIPPKFDAAWAFLDGKAAVVINKKLFFINNRGNKIDVVLEKYIPFNEGLSEVFIEGKYGLINTKGEVIVPMEYDEIESFIDGVAIVVKLGKKGFINTKGNLIGSVIYDDVSTFEEGFAAVKSDNRWGFINTKGKLIVNVIYDGFNDFNGGFAGVMLDDEWGFVNAKGELIKKVAYSDMEGFENGFVMVEKKDKWRLLNSKGKYVGNQSYDYCDGFSEGLWKVEKDDKQGYINAKDEIIVDIIYDRIGDFEDGFAKVLINDKVGLINTKGKLVVAIQYDDIIDYNDKFIEVKLNNKHGIVNIKGEIIVEIEYEMIGEINDGYSILYKNNKDWSLVNLNTKEIIALEYDKVFNFKEELAIVEKNKKRGYINAKGELVIDLQYDKSCYFQIGLAKVNIDNKFGLINKKGVLVVPHIYDDMEIEDVGYITSNEYRYGFIDSKGIEKIPIQYDIIVISSNFIYAIYKDEVIVYSTDGKKMYYAIGTNRKEIDYNL